MPFVLILVLDSGHAYVQTLMTSISLLGIPNLGNVACDSGSLFAPHCVPSLPHHLLSKHHYRSNSPAEIQGMDIEQEPAPRGTGHPC